MNQVVYDPAKLANLKANHNGLEPLKHSASVVYDPAKLANLKANHNNIRTVC